MATSDDYLRLYMESLAAEGLDTGDLEADLIGMIGRLRSKRDKAIREMEAAKLLPYGADAVMKRQECCRATVYNRARRGRLSKSVAVG